jgi:DNA-binding CsgD family transcriptional regulator
VTDNAQVRLLERESQLAALAGYAAEAGQGDGRLVLIAGEAGVGKSALVEELERAVPEACWLWGACDGLFTPRPLGPLFDVAGQLGGELLRLCRAGAARESLFAALLAQVSEPGTRHVMVVEDVHWADEATLDLLRFLGRRLRGVSALIIATYRDEGLGHGDPLRIALGDLAALRSARRLGLAPLSEAAVGVLATEHGLAADALFRLTGGNPFYVTELIRAGMDQVPASARDALLARSARLTGAARAVLDVAALTGNRVELRLLESVQACPPPVLDELVASGLLAADATSVRFRHEIARLAAEQAVAAHRRSAIHARILAALGLLACDDDARMAYHAEAARDAAAVLRHAPAAARRAAGLGSHREAAAQYERAVRFAAAADPAMTAGLYAGLADEASLVDRWQDAANAREHALAFWHGTGDRLREGDTLLRLSRARWRLGRGTEAVAAAEAAVAVLEQLGPSTELAWALANLAAQRMRDNEHRAAVELARRAQAVATPLGALDVVSDALNTEGCAAHGLGQDWTGRLRAALDIAVARGLPEQAGRAYANLASMYLSQRRLAEAEQFATAGIAYCEDHDIATFATCLQGSRTDLLAQAGRWDESAALSTELLAQSISPVNRLNPLVNLGLIRVRRGEPGAWDCLDAAATTADGTGEPAWILCVRLARAEAHWLAGEADLARQEAERADDASAGCDGWERGAAAAWLGRTSSGRAPRGDLAEPCRLQLAGDGEQAARVWGRLGCRYEAALALLDTGREAALREAFGIFEGLGASAPARIARQRLRQAGARSVPVGPRTATRAHPLGLTRREGEVLDLIGAGHTNAEIAQKLFITVKTVDHHVSAVLAKLNAPNRLAAAARAAGLRQIAG